MSLLINESPYQLAATVLVNCRASPRTDAPRSLWELRPARPCGRECEEERLYEAIKDKNMVKTGDLLYHPDPLPGGPSILPGEGIGGGKPPLPAHYVMGHDDRERERLALQASILNPFTEELLRRAGISTGMRVLDLGCGIGEVSLMAARLVGRHGAVTAIDIDQAALATAADRAREQALGNLKFVEASIDQYEPERVFDAVIGRHILIHSRDPLAILSKAYECLSQAGVAVFRDFFDTMTQGNIGTRLLHLLLEAGFRAPDCRRVPHGWRRGQSILRMDRGKLPQHCSARCGGRICQRV